MICKECGGIIKKDDKTCSFCGCNLQEQSVSSDNSNVLSLVKRYNAIKEAFAPQTPEIIIPTPEAVAIDEQKIDAIVDKIERVGACVDSIYAQNVQIAGSATNIAETTAVTSEALASLSDENARTTEALAALSDESALSRSERKAYEQQATEQRSQAAKQLSDIQLQGKQTSDKVDSVHSIATNIQNTLNALKSGVKSFEKTNNVVVDKKDKDILFDATLTDSQKVTKILQDYEPGAPSSTFLPIALVSLIIRTVLEEYADNETSQSAIAKLEEEAKSFPANSPKQKQKYQEKNTANNFKNRLLVKMEPEEFKSRDLGVYYTYSDVLKKIDSQQKKNCEQISKIYKYTSSNIHYNEEHNVKSTWPDGKKQIKDHSEWLIDNKIMK